MQYWKTYIDNGNHYYRLNQFDEAEEQYNKARDRAGFLYTMWYKPDAAVSALVVSYVNLAYLYLKRQQGGKTFALIDSIQEILEYSSRQASISKTRLAVILEASRWLQQTKHSLVLRFDRNNGISPCQCDNCRRDVLNTIL